MQKDLIQTIKIVVLAFVLTLGVNYVFAWTGPTAVPPNDNTPTPVNVGTTDQVKNAGLGLDALSVFGSSFIQNSLGIADSTPDNGLLLDVEGGIGATEYCDEDGDNCFTINEIQNTVAKCLVCSGPPTSSIDANPLSITSGESTTLSWTSSGAVSASIDQGVGSVSVNGSVDVAPTTTTTYTITVDGPGGTSDSSVTVTVTSSCVLGAITEISGGLGNMSLLSCPAGSVMIGKDECWGYGAGCNYTIKCQTLSCTSGTRNEIYGGMGYSGMLSCPAGSVMTGKDQCWGYGAGCGFTIECETTTETLGAITEISGGLGNVGMITCPTNSVMVGKDQCWGYGSGCNFTLQCQAIE